MCVQLVVGIIMAVTMTITIERNINKAGSEQLEAFIELLVIHGV